MDDTSNDDTLITLSLPAMMMPDILALKEDDESLEDCIIDLVWIGVSRMKDHLVWIGVRE